MFKGTFTLKFLYFQLLLKLKVVTVFIKRVLSYKNAWEELNKNNYNELCDFLLAINFNVDRELKSYTAKKRANEYMKCCLDIRTRLYHSSWSEDFNPSIDSIFSDRVGYDRGLGHIKNGVSIKNHIDDEKTLLWLMKDIKDGFYLKNIGIGIEFTLDSIFLEKRVSDFDKTHNILQGYLRPSLEVPFLIFELSIEEYEIEVISIRSDDIEIERSIEFKPEHYQAGLGILSYFGTVMRKKYPEQNAKVRIEQDDNTVRLVVESVNGDKEIIEHAFDEFGLVIHGDMQPENFYDNHLDVAELKTKLGIFETELKFQHQLIKMKEHRIDELEKDKMFLKDTISQALVRPNAPIYITNQQHYSQSTVINHKAEFSTSNDELEELIDLVDSDALKNRLATIQNALEVSRNADQSEEVKDSSGMKKLAKFLKEANEVGTEANSFATKSGEALGLIKNLGKRYNRIAEWCGMPVIPSIFVKE